ncbi:ribonuclease H-like [Molossus nigricans]
MELIDFLNRPHKGLSDYPLEDPGLFLFVDGSSTLGPNGLRWVAYAVVTISSTVEAQRLPDGTSSQKAELIALTQALTLAQGKWVTIYTDSKYALFTAHSHSAFWQEWGFFTTKGSPIINATLISKLLEAPLLPVEVAVVHCRGH